MRASPSRARQVTEERAMQNFGGKVAFVTGGASGIGFGMVRAFLAEGMRVAIADISDVNLADAREKLAGSNAVHLLKVDVSDRDQVRAAAQETLDVFGKIHVLCNNAGIGGGGTAADPDFDAWDRAMNVNLGGVVNGIKIITPIIRAQGEGGHVVNTSSMAGVVPLPELGAYATAKYAVRGLTDSLRMTLAPEGIGVSCLFPGATRSRLVDLSEEAPDAANPDAANFDAELLRTLRAAMEVAMDPLEVGRAVVSAIRENTPYILTHGEFLDEVRAIHRQIEAAFPAEHEIPEARRQFEVSRRRFVEQLNAIPTRD
jgi:NAD(P)-dependent dehydrogenase (short-subunit alcohol dehydrogenase family)